MSHCLNREVVRVGCCGFPVSRNKYFSTFSIVELQNTFYEPPDLDWAESFRESIPQGFAVTMKAWQALTHLSTSPTWRKMKATIRGAIENYGWLKPTNENIEAWARVIEVAKALRACAVVLQTPPNMPFNEESVDWVKAFFREAMSIAPKDLVVGWEPRGEWASNKSTEFLRAILEGNGVTNVVDLFKRMPVYVYKVLYTRLHGIGPGETNYKYKYSDEDLINLAKYLMELKYPHSYVMFNNVHMFSDAKRFKEIAEMRGVAVG
ncbi:MAG: DUF72 domain-containing protein [Desulfurococcaceae archaeon]